METQVTRPKLLLADDSVTIRKVVELTFADEGIEVFAVGNGDAAMQKFIEVQPDIVLVDVEMPSPNGYQICDMIKQDEATKHIPVLLLVGSFEPFDQDEAERVAADGFMTKPFHSIRELVARVSDLLGTSATPLAADPDTADIEHLYNSSFAETMPIEDYTTEEDLFTSPAETQFDDASLDDEMIEAIRPSGNVSENGASESEQIVETIELVKDFDWSPAAKVEDDKRAGAEAEFEPQFAVAEGEIPTDEADSDRAPTDAAIGEPSEELISLIARRVVEKLSDRVIRDIAREAVPRIAEKLIREALKEEKQD